MVTIEQVKELRDATGISVMQCKNALEQAGGDMEKAKEVLKKTGAKISAKKGSRELGAGRVQAYVHATGTSGTILSLLCETDFVAKNEEFKKLAYDIAMHVTAMHTENPETLLDEDFVKDASQSVKELIESFVQKFGERIEVSEFTRFEI